MVKEFWVIESTGKCYINDYKYHLFLQQNGFYKRKNDNYTYEVVIKKNNQINIIQIGAGQVTINAVTSGTTTIASTGGTPAAPKLRVQYSSATLIKVNTDLWYVIGDIS